MSLSLYDFPETARSSFESLRTNGGKVEITLGEFPFMLSQVEAFFGSSSGIANHLRRALAR
jgi:hypothetical protein